MSRRVYDMSAAWALHILLLVVIGVGWAGALVWSLTRPAGDEPWWFFAVGVAVFAVMLPLLLRTLARRVEVDGEEVTVITAFGTRRTRLSRIDRPTRGEGSWMQQSWMKTVRYRGGVFTVPGYSDGRRLMRDLRASI